MQRFHRKDNIRRSRISGLQIAVLVALTASVASGSCTIDGGVTRCEKTGLNCPPGWVCSADEDVCIRAGSCGNGVVSDGETCDDGNNKSGDGCSADCSSDESCGNSIIDVAVGEICDDGGRVDGDGCSSDCESEACGNQTVDRGAGEECDTGPGDSFGCDVDCTFVRCGDGYRNTVAEDCEAMDSESTALCDGDCSFPKCGDKFVNPHFPVYTPPPGQGPKQMEECDAGVNTESCNGNDNDASTTVKGKGNCQKPGCGDGYKNPQFRPSGMSGPPEECDEGGTAPNGDGPGCNGIGPGNAAAACQKAVCGDGYKNPQFRPSGMSGPPEECDEGGTAPNGDGPGCNGVGPGDAAAACQKAVCGDGYKNPQFRPSGPSGPPEKCDLGATAPAPNGDGPGCNGHGPGNLAATCQEPACGDGYKNPQFRPSGMSGPVEGCDEGGNAPNGNGSRCNGNGPGNPAAQCQESQCGDGYFNREDEREECDPMAPEPDAPCVGAERCNSLCICAQ